MSPSSGPWFAVATDPPNFGLWLLETGLRSAPEPLLSPLIVPCTLCRESHPQPYGLARMAGRAFALCESCVSTMSEVAGESGIRPQDFIEPWAELAASDLQLEALVSTLVASIDRARPRFVRGSPLSCCVCHAETRLIGGRNGALCGPCAAIANYVLEQALPEWTADKLEIHRLEHAWTDLRCVTVAPAIAALVPKELAQRLDVIPLCRNPRGLVLAMAEPTDRAAIAEVRKICGMPVEIVAAPRWRVREAIARSYG